MTRFQEGKTSQITATTSNSSLRRQRKSSKQLEKVWAIPERVTRSLTSAQKSVLNKISDRGEQSGNKASTEKAEKELRKALKAAEYLPVSKIKSYFSRRTALKKKKKIICESSESEEREETDCDLDSDSDYSDDSDDSKANDQEIERFSVTASISVAVSGVDIEKDEWIAVDTLHSLCSLILKKKKFKFISCIDHLRILAGFCGLSCLVVILIYHGYVKVSNQDPR